MNYFRKSYETIGYTHPDGFYLCIDCSLSYEKMDLQPIFLSEEFDYSPSCDNCHEPLDEDCNIITES